MQNNDRIFFFYFAFLVEEKIEDRDNNRDGNNNFIGFQIRSRFTTIFTRLYLQHKKIVTIISCCRLWGKKFYAEVKGRKIKMFYITYYALSLPSKLPFVEKRYENINF